MTHTRVCVCNCTALSFATVHSQHAGLPTAQRLSLVSSKDFTLESLQSALSLSSMRRTHSLKLYFQLEYTHSSTLSSSHSSGCTRLFIPCSPLQALCNLLAVRELECLLSPSATVLMCRMQQSRLLSHMTLSLTSMSSVFASLSCVAPEMQIPFSPILCTGHLSLFTAQSAT